MLVGLLFAIHDADDRPDRLAATLPFGGTTLVEYQARMLVAAGVAQIIVVVARLTPELLGAMSRICRRGVTVDAVRSAVEAAEKLHPLSRVLMLADGLTTTEAAVAQMAREPRDALLIVAEDEAGPAFERIGGQMAWAGIASIDPRRMVEVAALPRDYDLQSTLVRVAVQARATMIRLPADAVRDGHGIDHDARALEARGRAVLASIVAQRRGWLDRWILAPIARAALPPLVARGIASGLVASGAAVAGVAGLMFTLLGFMRTGLICAMVGCLGFALGATLAGLRDEAGLARGQAIAAAGLPALVLILLGFRESVLAADGAPRVMAVALVVLGALGEQAIRPPARRMWWGSAPGYLIVVTGATCLGVPVVGLAVAAAYAAATLSGAINDLRRQP